MLYLSDYRSYTQAVACVSNLLRLLSSATGDAIN